MECQSNVSMVDSTLSKSALIPIEKKAWVSELDYLRAIAVFCVIFIHVMAWYNTSFFYEPVKPIGIISLFISTFISFAVPMFIFISGFTLSLNYNKKFDLIYFYRKRFKYIIPPYLIFSLIYIMLDYFRKDSFSISKTIFKLLTGSAFGHLWFFAIIIQLYLLYPMIIKCYNHIKNKMNFLFVFLMTQVLWLLIRPLFYKFIFDLSVLKMQVFEILIRRVCLSYIFYFSLGIYICSNLESLKIVLKQNKKRILCFLSLTVLILNCANSFIFEYNAYTLSKYDFLKYRANIYYSIISILELIEFVSIILLLFYLSNKAIKSKKLPNNILGMFGKYSFGIFLIHFLFLVIFQDILNKVGFKMVKFDCILIYLFLSVFIFLISFVAVYLVSYIPRSNLIIGMHSRTLKEA